MYRKKIKPTMRRVYTEIHDVCSMKSVYIQDMGIDSLRVKKVDCKDRKQQKICNVM